MYGEPTTGLNYFLSGGVFTISTWDQSMPRMNFGGELLRGELIPFLPENMVVQKIENLLDNDEFYINELSRQQGKFCLGTTD